GKLSWDAPRNGDQGHGSYHIYLIDNQGNPLGDPIASVEVNPNDTEYSTNVNVELSEDAVALELYMDEVATGATLGIWDSPVTIPLAYMEDEDPHAGRVQSSIHWEGLL